MRDSFKGQKTQRETKKLKNDQQTHGEISEKLKRIADAIRDPMIKVVSFDIFDTLLLRPVLTPTDIFQLLENKMNISGFRQMRITAEVEARKRKAVYVEDITIDDIYHTYAELFHTSDEEAQRIKEEELRIEYSTLYARKSAKYLFEQAKQSGKLIIIISDMYMFSSFLDKVLKKNGYNGYQHIYVSSEMGVTKASKMMYQAVLSDLAIQGVQPAQVLHIGDNEKSDVNCAVAMGINAKHLPKPADKANEYVQLRRANSFILAAWANSNNSMLYGILFNLYFDDPFIQYDRDSYFNADTNLMGYWFAPLMIGLTKWMIERVEKNEVEQLLWIWRDGYLPEKLFQIMRPYFTERPIEMGKLYLSRSFRIPFFALTPNGLFNTLLDHPFSANSSVDDFIRYRLLCEDGGEQYSEILSIFTKHGYLNGNAQMGDFKRYRGFLHELEPYFIKNAQYKIKLYRNYIEQNVDREKKLAVFDRAPRGKCSRFLYEFLGIKSICFTTEVFDTPKTKLFDVESTVESYLEYGMSYVNRMGGIWSQIIELIICDKAPGFNDIIENSDGTYSVQLKEKNERIQDSDEIVDTIQRSIVDFVHVFVEVLGEYMPYMVIDRHGVFDYTAEAIIAPCANDAELIAKITPGASRLVPVNERMFINWYNAKIHKKYDLKNKLGVYIRETGRVVAEKLGITEPVRMFYHRMKAVYRGIKNKGPIITTQSLMEITDRHIDYLEKLDCTNVNSLFLGSTPKEVGPYFNELFRLNKEFQFLFVAAGFMKLPTWFDVPCITGPESFSFWGIEGQESRIEVPSEIKKVVKEKTYLNDLALRRELSGYSKSIATVLAYEEERYYSALIEKINPKLVMVWNYWGFNSLVPCEVAKQKGIPVVSVERGFLEGTMIISRDGYGKDSVMKYPEAFCSLPVDSQELEKASEIIGFLGDSGFNRYQQPVNDAIKRLQRRLDNGKPSILLAGAFDFENPSLSRDKESERIYGLPFATSREAMIYIAKLAKKNDWNFIYKPHPLMYKRDFSRLENKKLNNVLYVKDANINELIDSVDVVICMITGVSHIALTRNKPVVQLGNTPLKHKGCCYEVLRAEDIESEIKKAIQNGYTATQKCAFVKYVAQANRYYYFDDLTARPIRYGRSMEEANALLNDILTKRMEGTQ